MSSLPALRVANCSGFFGDRLSAAREMVDGGPIDILTGDWLAELTMGVLARQQRRDPARGYAGTFLEQLDGVLADCLDRGIRIVSNAGGLNPHGCAAHVTALAERLGRPIRVAVVDGDDATQAFAQARAQGWSAPHLDSDEPFPAEVAPEFVSAYLGCWGITEALRQGADVVVTGRVTDASVIVGPAAWHFGWARDDWDALAGAVAAGHVIECGTQATGGNFSFFDEVPGLVRPGFPIAEISADGSSVITKHPGTGGAVTVETVTAQLLYEIDGPRYLNPDVVARLDTVQLEQVSEDRVRIFGVRGEPSPSTIKVGALLSEGWRNETTFVLTGSDVEAKAELACAALWAAIPGGADAFDRVSVRLLRADAPDPPTMTSAVALLGVTVAAADREQVDAFSRAAVETGLASYPGLYFTSPPGHAKEMTVFWPALMPAEDFVQRVTLDGRAWTVPSAPSPSTDTRVPLPVYPEPEALSGPTIRVPLGVLVGSRSGDKAGNATLGVWARGDATHAWLRWWWSEERLRTLLPESLGCTYRLWELPHLRACGATIVGLLGRGVAANPDLDSQAKGLGEYLRAKLVDVPASLLSHGSQ